MEKEHIESFQKLIWNFYKKNKRDLPWRNTTDPYNILISEVMLQQTQADRVVSFYKTFIKRFPNFKTLAGAKFSEIYPLWQGLGYNRRALALQKLAQEVTVKYRGKLPLGIIELQQLPGIGPYTARAVSIFSQNRPIACLETNIRRVFIHHFFEDAEVVTDEEIAPLLELALPVKKSREWHWALMDYGAHLKSTIPNPNRRHKNYSIQSKFEGSLRQIRGAVLKNLVTGKMTVAELVKNIGRDTEKVKNVISALEKEGLVEFNKKFYSLK